MPVFSSGTSSRVENENESWWPAGPDEEKKNCGSF